MKRNRTPRCLAASYALAAVMLLTGCGAGDERGAASRGGKDTTGAAVGTSPKRSGIHAVPVPEMAKADAQMSGNGREVYRLPAEVPMDVLVTFYRDAMPVGEPFGNLVWCGYTPVPEARTLERAWRVPGTQDFLALRVLQDNVGPLVVIIDDRGNAARVCQRGAGDSD